MDSSMNNLLKWSIENSVPSDPNNPNPPPSRPIDAEAVQRVFGNTPSDADLMKASMAAIRAPDITLENKIIAFDNFEQLVENLDNADNMEPLGLWTPLVEELDSDEAELRKMAAWCLGTAVQNNEKAQERILAVKGIPALVKVATKDSDSSVRRKAAYALSSAVRNYQPGLDELCAHLPAGFVDANEKIKAGDMDRIDAIISRLKAI